MPTLNTAARNYMADAAGTCCGTGLLQILAGVTVLAQHTVAGFSAASNGLITGSAIADVTVSESGTATSAKLSQAGREITLTVGTSGAEVILSTLNYVQGNTSKITSVSITYPAS